MPANYTDNPHNPENYAASLFASAGATRNCSARGPRAPGTSRAALCSPTSSTRRFHRVAKYDEAMSVLDMPAGACAGAQGVARLPRWRLGPERAGRVLRVPAPARAADPFPRNSLVLLDEVSSRDPDDRASA
jgi:hypothetical protein